MAAIYGGFTKTPFPSVNEYDGGIPCQSCGIEVSSLAVTAKGAMALSATCSRCTVQSTPRSRRARRHPKGTVRK